MRLLVAYDSLVPFGWNDRWAALLATAAEGGGHLMAGRVIRHDGAGVLVQIPDRFFREEMAEQRIELPPAGQ